MSGCSLGSFCRDLHDGTDPSNEGKLQIDATAADQYIKFPADINLLNE